MFTIEKIIAALIIGITLWIFRISAEVYENRQIEIVKNGWYIIPVYAGAVLFVLWAIKELVK